MSTTRRPRRRIVEQDSTLHYAVALQDHFIRKFQLGGVQKQPCQLPGSELTLAQRVGLIPKPEQLLTQQQWNEVHGLARQRKDWSHACAICLEKFKAEKQVLLSCSHIFHHQCLAAFEHHVQVQACPLCRKQWYQKRVITDAADAYRHLCATRIQAAVRGWLCRKHALVELLSIPQTERLRRLWAAARLRHAAHGLEGLLQQSTNDLDQLEAELDATLAASRQQAAPPRAHNLPEQAIGSSNRLDKQPDERYSLLMQFHTIGGRQQPPASDRHQATTGADCHPSHQRTPGNVPSTIHKSMRSSGSGGGRALAPGNLRRRKPLEAHPVAGQAAFNPPVARPSASSFLSDCPAQQPQQQQHRHQRRSYQQQEQQLLPPDSAHNSEAALVSPAAAAVNWEAVVGQACERGETECAICLGPLVAPREAAGVALLSCSHIFHMQCVVSFEEFETARSGQPSCPICRAVYSTRCFALPDAC